VDRGSQGVLDLLEDQVPLFRAGRTGGPTLELRAGSRVFSWALESLRTIYFEAIPRRMQHADAERSAGE
jgi:hypothetical protein